MALHESKLRLVELSVCSTIDVFFGDTPIVESINFILQTAPGLAGLDLAVSTDPTDIIRLSVLRRGNTNLLLRLPELKDFHPTRIEIGLLNLMLCEAFGPTGIGITVMTHSWELLTQLFRTLPGTVTILDRRDHEV